MDMSLAGLAIIRWSDRHYGYEATTQFEQELDMEAPDEWMKSRFVEWKFLYSQWPLSVRNKGLGLSQK